LLFSAQWNDKEFENICTKCKNPLKRKRTLNSNRDTFVDLLQKQEFAAACQIEKLLTRKSWVKNVLISQNNVL
jgi:hypothetical protein